jgi:hypothetical protein
MKERATEPSDGDWRVVARWREYEGEQRANVLRVLGIACFYLVELLNRYGLHLGPLDLAPVPGVDARFHAAITALAVVWVALAGGVVVALRSRLFPPWLKFLTAGADTLLLTSMLSIADGPASPLVVVFFPVLALSALRESSALVRFSTCASLVGYGVLLAGATWLRPATRVPVYQATLALLALALTGLVLDRVVRAAAEAATEYARRRRAPPAAPAEPDAEHEP